MSLIKKKFIYLDEYENSKNNFHVVEIDFDSVNTKEKLLRKYYDSLQFPGYFGFNWDALSDLLRDLSWLDAKRVVIKHTGDCEGFSELDLKVYIKILFQVVNDWCDDDEGEVVVCFPLHSKAKVECLLSLG